MAVFTEVSFDEAAALVDAPRPRRAARARGIRGGIENTNYFADTDRGRYVLTLFERLTRRQLPFYLHLMKHLAERGIPVPRAACRRRAARCCTRCSGKPAARGRPAARRAPTRARRRALRRRRRDAGAHAPGRRATSRRAPAEPARAGLVERDRAGRRCRYLDAEQARADRRRARLPAATSPRSPAYAALPRGRDPRRPVPRQRHVRRAARSPASSTSISPASTPCSSTSPSASTTGASTSPSGRLDEDRAQRLRRRLRRACARSRRAELRLLPAMMRAGALRFWISRAVGPAPAARRRRARPRTTPTTSSACSCSGARRPGIRAASAAGLVVKLQLVPPRQGVVWVRKGFQVFARQPLGFASLFAACLFVVAPARR